VEIRERYENVKLFCGILYRGEEIFDAVKKRLVDRFEDEIDSSAGPFDFKFTDYYQKEMGDRLKRRFVSFKKLISPENSYNWKIISNSIEKEFYISGKFPRQVNLDPGYLNLSRLVLFSTKDFYHRVYLGKGIFAEVTLYFEKNRFVSLPWTYPDYKSEEYLGFFYKLREIYRLQMKDEDVDKNID
jgi:hypothetical protein